MLGSADTTSKSRSLDSASHARRSPEATTASHVAYSRLAAGTSKTPDSGSQPGRQMDLTAVVECEIIPRLMLSHTNDLEGAAQLGNFGRVGQCSGFGCGLWRGSSFGGGVGGRALGGLGVHGSCERQRRNDRPAECAHRIIPWVSTPSLPPVAVRVKTARQEAA